MDRCPICRGRVNDKAQCKRCGAELCAIISARDEAEELTWQAIKEMENGKYVKAKSIIELALTLEYTPIRSKMLAFVGHELAKPPKRSILQRLFGPS